MDNDTVFLLQENLPGCGQHNIFIHPNPKAENYLAINQFDITEAYRDGYESYLQALTSNGKRRLQHHDRAGLSQNWIPVYLYNHRYYAYDPSDNGWSSKFQVNDSTTVQYYMDGPVVNRIIEIKKHSEEWYTVLLSDGGIEQTVVDDRIEIKILSSDRRLALFNFYIPGDDRPTHQTVMIDASKLTGFPLIVNACYNCKTSEWDFDTPDFDNLFKSN